VFSCKPAACDGDDTATAAKHVCKVVKREHKRKLDGNAEVAVMRHLTTVDPQGAYTASLVEVRKVSRKLATHSMVYEQFKCDLDSDGTDSEDGEDSTEDGEDGGEDDSVDSEGTDDTDYTDRRSDAMRAENAKARSKKLAMIAMTNVGRPLREQFHRDLPRLKPPAALRKAVGAFASLLRGLAVLHANKVFHFDLNGGNLMVDSRGLGRFIDFGCFDMMRRLVLDNNYETRYPIYINPFDGLVLNQVRWHTLEVAVVAAGAGSGLGSEPGTGTGTGPGTGPETGAAKAGCFAMQLKAYGPSPTFDVVRMAKEYGKCYKTSLYKIRALCSPQSIPSEFATDTPTPPRYLEVHPLPRPDLTREDTKALQDLFRRNCEFWVNAMQSAQWGAFDVYGLALSFVDSVNYHCCRTHTFSKLGSDTQGMLTALQDRVLHPMSRPLAAIRFTAADAWAAVKTLCDEYEIAIPAVDGV
jgi:hypothetical protein